MSITYAGPPNTQTYNGPYTFAVPTIGARCGAPDPHGLGYACCRARRHAGSCVFTPRAQ